MWSSARNTIEKKNNRDKYRILRWCRILLYRLEQAYDDMYRKILVPSRVLNDDWGIEWVETITTFISKEITQQQFQQLSWTNCLEQSISPGKFNCCAFCTLYDRKWNFIHFFFGRDEEYWNCYGVISSIGLLWFRLTSRAENVFYDSWWYQNIPTKLTTDPNKIDFSLLLTKKNYL